MVRLKVFSSVNNELLWISFNSKMVRLKVYANARLERYEEGFNSKMVRLKENPTTRTPVFDKFQFQNGAVKSLRAGQITGKLYSVSIPKWCG